MFEVFQLKVGKTGLMGYEWPVEKPRLLICLIHGVGDHAGRYDRVGAHLQQERIATFAMDLRGHGGSVGKRGHTGSRQQVRQDIDALLRHASEKHPGVPTVLYGHSMGGNIVLDYRFRGRRSGELLAYFVTSPWLELVAPIPRPVYWSIRGLRALKPDLKLTAPIKNSMLGNRSVLEQESGRKLIHRYISAETAVDRYEFAADLLAGQVSDLCGGDQKPLFILHGTKDPVCDIEGSRKLAAMKADRCTLIEWEGYYHELINGHETSDGAEVIECIAGLLAGLVSANAADAADADQE